MKTVSDLIDDLCPNGVNYVSLKDVAAIGTGSSNRNESNTEGKYPFYVRSKEVKRIDTFEFDETAIVIPGEGGVGDIFHYAEGKYALHQRAYRIAFHDERVIAKFAYYYLKVEFKAFILKKAVDGTVTSIRKPMIEDFRIPLPPIEVQREIVRILDTFTELETELEAELEARKTQYEYYRSHLLSFRDAEAVGVRRVQLGDICEYRKERSNYSTGTFLYVGVQDLLQERRGVSDDARFVSSAGHDIFMPGDVLLGNIRPYLKKVWHADVEGRTNGDVLVVTPRKEALTELDTSYLYFLLSSDDFFGYCVQTSKGAKMPRGDKQAILRYEIPVPSIETQRRIVKVLTSFETLTQDLDIGLPAEISARRQQYEYYRNKLLTFKELEVA